MSASTPLQGDVAAGIVILGLDIDGVFHPEGCPPDEEWVHRERFEATMREVPEVMIVITSMWRLHHSLANLRSFFAPDIAERILGVTPELVGNRLDDSRGIRQRELEAWISENAPGSPWLGLDDRAEYYDPDCPDLLLIRHANYGGIGLQFHDLEELESRLKLLLARAALSGNSLPKSLAVPSIPTQYVLIAAVDESAQKMILLMKDRGPSHLIGKATLPGGRLEPTDASPEAAGRRELMEETGVDAPLDAFRLIDVDTNDVRVLATVFASCDISGARTMESEVVFAVDIDTLIATLNGAGAEMYAADMAERMNMVAPHILATRLAYTNSESKKVAAEHPKSPRPRM